MFERKLTGLCIVNSEFFLCFPQRSASLVSSTIEHFEPRFHILLPQSVLVEDPSSHPSIPGRRTIKMRISSAYKLNSHFSLLSKRATSVPEQCSNYCRKPNLPSTYQSSYSQTPRCFLSLPSFIKLTQVGQATPKQNVYKTHSPPPCAVQGATSSTSTTSASPASKITATTRS